ncbi:CPBP family intramembrane metalloprotease, partial [Staphylococcus pseudintermedius]|nr:CPBP family intramembrane metalloprotease [Staphylococcus pseudintermedius]
MSLRSTFKTLMTCLVTLIVMTLINALSPLIGLFNFIGMDDVGYVAFHVLILVLTSIIFILWIKKGFKADLNDYRITAPYLKVEWFLISLVGIGLMYLLFNILTNGKWEFNNGNLFLLTIVILITSLTTAISEELFFRGFLMGYIEKKTNINFSLIITSFLFGAVHLMNGVDNLKTLFLVITGIFIAGIFYGLISIYYRTIWASITVHFLFDSTQLFDITTEKHSQSLIEYVYHSPYITIT